MQEVIGSIPFGSTISILQPRRRRLFRASADFRSRAPMRPSAERLEELRTGLNDVSERTRKIALGYVADIGGAGHPASAARVIDAAEQVMLRLNGRLKDALDADERAKIDPDRTPDAIYTFESVIRGVRIDLKYLDLLAPDVEAAVSGAHHAPRPMH